MSEHPGKLNLVVYLDGCLSCRFSGDDQGRAGHHDSELNDQFIATLDATVDSDAITSSGLRLSDCCVEKFRHADDVHDATLVNSHFSPHSLQFFHLFKNRTNCKLNRFRAAPMAFNSKALEGRGIPSRASVHALSGALKRNHNNPNTAKTTASKIPTAIAAIIASLSDIRNSFGFAPLRIHSLKSHLRSVVAASVASIVLARPSFADADREGV